MENKITKLLGTLVAMLAMATPPVKAENDNNQTATEPAPITAVENSNALKDVENKEIPKQPNIQTATDVKKPEREKIRQLTQEEYEADLKKFGERIRSYIFKQAMDHLIQEIGPQIAEDIAKKVARDLAKGVIDSALGKIEEKIEPRPNPENTIPNVAKKIIEDALEAGKKLDEAIKNVYEAKQGTAEHKEAIKNLRAEITNASIKRTITEEQQGIINILIASGKFPPTEPPEKKKPEDYKKPKTEFKFPNFKFEPIPRIDIPLAR